MEKIDLTKTHKAYYTAKRKPELVTIERATFLSICGKGDPSQRLLAERIETIYPVAYTIKFRFKEKGKDFVVPKLEALWWYDEQKYPGRTMADAVSIPRSDWEYRLLIRMPQFVMRGDLDEAVDAVAKKKGLTAARNVELFELTEGRCVQMMHVGPFSKELETLKVINTFCQEHNLKRNGFYHEIYLSDFRKTPPEKLKTILREPVKE